MNAKSISPKGRINRAAINFLHHLFEAGVTPEILSRFSLEPNYRSIFHSLLVGTVARLNPSSGGTLFPHEFTPLALDFRLGQAEPINTLKFENRVHEEYQDICGGWLPNKQPGLESARIAVIQFKKVNRAKKILLELYRYKYKEYDSENGLRGLKAGLGIAHALEVANHFMVQPYQETSELLELRGTGSLGKCLFILLDYIKYQRVIPRNHEEKQEGVPTLGWMEIRVVNEYTEYDPIRCSVQIHDTLDIILPQKAMIACANVEWFRER
jgi:hypothetical protein